MYEFRAADGRSKVAETDISEADASAYEVTWFRTKTRCAKKGARSSSSGNNEEGECRRHPVLML